MVKSNKAMQNRKAAARRIKQKKQKNNSDNPLIQNAQVAKLAAQLYASSQWRTLKSTRERILTVNYETLEKMSERNPAAIFSIQHRCRQMKQFCKIAVGEGDRGFRVLSRETATGSKKEQQERCKVLENFFVNTGFVNDVDRTYPSRYRDPNALEREDNLTGFVEYLVRDMLVFDQNATELRYTRKGEVYDFWYVDPTTIKRVDSDESEFAAGISFVQEDSSRLITRKAKKGIIATFTADQLIFDYSNKRSRMKYRGYGYSLLEMAIDVTTVLIFAQTYNKDLFLKEKIPKGFLKIMGDADQEMLNTVRNYWISEMSGYGAKFGVPIIPSGKDGMGIDWQSLGQSNRDMEYRQLFLLQLSIFGAIFGLDLAEVGIKTDNSNAIIGESGEPRIQASKDSGLGSIIAYVESYINKILAKVDDDYVFRFVGLKDEDRKAAADALKSELETFKTVNEIREEKGMDLLKDAYANVILNPQAIQVYMVDKQQEQVEESGEEMGFGEEDEEEEFEENFEDMEEKEEKSTRFNREKGQRFRKSKQVNRKRKYFSLTV